MAITNISFPDSERMRQQIQTADLPSCVLDREALITCLNKLHTPEQQEITEAYLNILKQATGIKPFAGYYLPWHTMEELVAFCSEHGISRESLTFLYEANLLDLPRGEEPASLSVHPGYPGPLRPVRQLRRRLNGGGW